MVRKVHKYADGGKIVKAPPVKKPTPPPPKPEQLGTGMVRKAADALTKARKKQEEDLGL